MLDKYVSGFLATVVIVLFIASCTAQNLSLLQESEDLTGAPVWVTRGCPSLYKGDDRHALFGVGSSANVNSLATGKKAKPLALKSKGQGKGQGKGMGLDRSDAVLQAKGQISPALHTIVETILQDYGANSGDTEFRSLAGDKQKLEELSKQITAMLIAEAPMVDSWVNANGTFYALVKCEPDALIYSVSSMQNLPEATRKGIIERVGKAFEKFDPHKAEQAVIH